MFRYLGMNDLSSVTQEQIINAFDYARTNKAIWDIAGPFFIQKENSTRVSHMKMEIRVGGPLSVNGVRYIDVNDRYQEQEDYVTQLMLEIEEFIEES